MIAWLTCWAVNLMIGAVAIGTSASRSNAPRFPSCPLWLKVLENPGSAHPPAHAHRHQAITRVTTLEFTNYSRGQLGSGTSKRMSQSNRAAVGVHAFRIESGLLNHRQRLRRKSLVQLDDVDVRKFQPRHLQRLRNREYGPESHFFGLVSRRGERNITCKRLDAESLRAFGGHDYCRSCAVGHLRRIARGHSAFDMKSGLEREQGFERGVGARPLVHFKNNFLALRLRAIGSSEAHRYRHNFVVELPRLDRGQRLPVAAQRKLISRFTRNSKALSQSLGGESHRKIRVRVMVHQPGVRRNL